MSILSPDDALACGSASMSSTFRSKAANEAAKLIVVVVYPTPPFWLAIAMILPIIVLFLQGKGNLFFFAFLQFAADYYLCC